MRVSLTPTHTYTHTIDNRTRCVTTPRYSSRRHYSICSSQLRLIWELKRCWKRYKINHDYMGHAIKKKKKKRTTSRLFLFDHRTCDKSVANDVSLVCNQSPWVWNLGLRRQNTVWIRSNDWYLLNPVKNLMTDPFLCPILYLLKVEGLHKQLSQICTTHKLEKSRAITPSPTEFFLIINLHSCLDYNTNRVRES